MIRFSRLLHPPGRREGRVLPTVQPGHGPHVQHLVARSAGLAPDPRTRAPAPDWQSRPVFGAASFRRSTVVAARRPSGVRIVDGDPSSRGEAAQARSFAGCGQRPLRVEAPSPTSDYRCGAALPTRMTAANGTPYRVFNFSEDGRDRTGHVPDALPAGAHRLKPRTLLLAGTKTRRSDAIKGAGGRATSYGERRSVRRSHTRTLPLEKRFFDIPLAAGAAPPRPDFGQYEHLASQGSDLYWMDDFGDTVSFSL